VPPEDGLKRIAELRKQHPFLRKYNHE